MPRAKPDLRPDPEALKPSVDAGWSRLERSLPCRRSRVRVSSSASRKSPGYGAFLFSEKTTILGYCKSNCKSCAGTAACKRGSGGVASRAWLTARDFSSNSSMRMASRSPPNGRPCSAARTGLCSPKHFRRNPLSAEISTSVFLRVDRRSSSYRGVSGPRYGDVATSRRFHGTPGLGELTDREFPGS